MKKRMLRSSTQKSAITATSVRPATRKIARGSVVVAGAVVSERARSNGMIGLGD
jgi:hypothetical protein